MARRKFLLVVLALLVIANGVYLFKFVSGSAKEIDAVWVAHMPELEASQRTERINLLRSSHSSDPRYPDLYLFENGRALPLFAKVASDCNVSAYVIKSYVTPRDFNEPLQMPDRFFTGVLDDANVRCLRTHLPEGYRLSKLAQPTKPSRIGWRKGDLVLSAPNVN